MKLLIIHLSDIHFRVGINSIFDKTQGLCGVVQSLCSEHPDLRSCFVIVSGDIAFTGDSKEYEYAVDFFANLEDKIRSLGILDQFEYIIVPGNHDCNFKVSKLARDKLIQKIVDKNDLSIVSPNIEILTSVQKDFFDFFELISPGLKLTGDNKLYWRKEFIVDRYKVVFCCYNTAYMSKQDEKQGQILFPVKKIEEKIGKSDLVCSIFHHPYNWFEVTNMKSFQNFIDKTTDIIFTGHGHDINSYEVRKITGEICEYTEGGVLQSQNSADSTFNSEIIDLQNKIKRRYQYVWNGNIYKPTKSTDWERLHRKESLVPGFVNNVGFISTFLNDPGTGFIHPRKDDLKLSDIFIYPDLKEIRLTKGKTEIPYETILGEKVFEYILNRKNLIIMGPDLSGKTSLAKMLYSEFLNHDFIPVLVHGKSINSANTDKITRMLYDTFSEQYSESKLNEYTQLPRNKKVIIIDALDKSELNQKGKKLFLEVAQNMFDRILVLGTHLIEFEEFLSKEAKFTLFLVHCEIAEFGYFRRAKLIEKWITLGQEYTIDNIELNYKIKTYENLINTIMAEKLLPSYPFVIIVILQTIEANIPVETTSGSYGHLFEFVITSAIAKSSKRVSDLRLKYNFLSVLAYYMHNRRITKVNYDHIREIDDIYFEKYDMRIHPERLLKELSYVPVINHQDGSYSFRYPYLYHFFTARYLNTNLRNPKETQDIQDKIKLMIKNVYKEEYANILLFLCHLSADPLVYETILENAKHIFKEHDPCNLDKDISFIRPPGEPQLSIAEKDVRETREEILKERDKIESEVTDIDTTYNMQDVQDINDLELLHKVNLALRTIQILGQILRNFAADLPKEIKLGLAEECYFIGLRTLTDFFNFLRDNFEDIRHEFSELLRERLNILDKKELNDNVDGRIFLGALFMTFSVIKGTSFSVGSEELKETYRRVLDKCKTTAVSLIDISIKLDHFKDIPQSEINALYTSIKHNHFSSTLLKLLVIQNLFMYYWPYAIRQSVLATLRVRIKDPRLISSPLKRASKRKKTKI